MKNIFILITFLSFTTLKLSAQSMQPVSYVVNAPEKTKASEGFSIDVNFTTSGDWYIYAPTGTNETQGMIETKINFTLPEGISLDGDLSLPAPQPYGSYLVYKGDNIPFAQKFKIDKTTKSGDYDIVCEVTFQTCNKSICLPPDTKTYTKTITIK